MDAPRPGHDQLMKELSGSASIRPSQIKKTPPPPVAPKPKVVSQRGPEIQMTSSYDDFPMPPPQHMLTTDDLPPPPPPLSVEFSVAANGQVLVGADTMNGGAAQPPAARSGSTAPASTMFTVKPFTPAGTTVTVTGGPRLGPRPFTPGGASAAATTSLVQPASDEGPAYPVKPPVQAAVDYPPPPPPLLTSGGAPVPPSTGTTMPSTNASRSLAGSQPFTATLGARPSPADAAAASGGGSGGGHAGVVPMGQPRPFTSSTNITIGLGGGGVSLPSAGLSVGLTAAAKPFGGAPSAAAAAAASPRAPSAASQASVGQPSPFGARAAEQPSSVGAKATVDLSFAASPASSSKDAGGAASSKPSLTAAPSASAGNVTIRPFVQPPQQQPGQPSSLAKVKTAPEAEVDSLTDLLLQNLEVAKDPACLGICAHCNKKIATDSAMCTAMDKSYHIECFACCSCKKLLTGQSFYLVRNAPQCEACYTASLEKCNTCQQPITDRILRATGKAYHARCFTCVVCNRSLDGVPFTVDSENQVHCVEDFHKKYAPRCSVCQLPIMPEAGQEETVRIVALDRNFHINCYKCEDCSLLLSSEADGRGCYPLDGHVLCRSCNSKRVFEKTTGGHQQQLQPQTVPASDF